MVRNNVASGRLGDVLVRLGLLSPSDLRKALQAQKTQARPLGAILLGQGMLNQRQLALALTCQTAFRLFLTLCLFLAALGIISPRKAKADSIKDIPAIMMVSATVSPKILPQKAFLFGMEERPSPDTGAFTKWSGVFERFEKKPNTQQVAQWQGALKPLAALLLKEKISAVNHLMNEKPYISDTKNWGASDYWATPFEFMAKGGDCEDFAIAKYAALRALGVSDSQMRLAIVQDTIKDIPHAVLAVYTDEGVYVLDNQIKDVINAERAGRYRPIYSINRQAWWLHTAPTETVIASAAGE